VLFALRPARRFVRQSSALGALRAIGRFMRDPALLATCVAGGSILLRWSAAFTFVTFLLAEPPFDLGTLALGNVFFVYLIGAVSSR